MDISDVQKKREWFFGNDLLCLDACTRVVWLPIKKRDVVGFRLGFSAIAFSARDLSPPSFSPYNSSSIVILKLEKALVREEGTISTQNTGFFC